MPYKVGTGFGHLGQPMEYWICACAYPDGQGGYTYQVDYVGGVNLACTGYETRAWMEQPEPPSFHIVSHQCLGACSYGVCKESEKNPPEAWPGDDCEDGTFRNHECDCQ
jgi:hypothetical protein